MKCENCEKEHDGSYGSGRFCSSKCARGFSTKSKRKEINEKVSKTLKVYDQNYCSICGKEISHKNNTKICFDCRSKYKKYDNQYYYLKDFRKRLKEKAVEYKGGKCVICGYNKSLRALDFHHVDETKKDFSISRNTNRSWESIKKELDKCILVCSNCHREIHDSYIEDVDLSKYLN